MSPDPDAQTLMHLHQLYGSQSHFIDGGLAREWAATFTADGEFHSPSYPEPVIGTADLTAFAERFFTGSRAAGVTSRHVVTTLCAESTGDTALRVRAYLQIISTREGGESRLDRLTTLTDDLVLLGGRWRIRRRAVRRDDAPDVPRTPTPKEHELTTAAGPAEPTGAEPTGAEPTGPGRVVHAPMTAVYPELRGKVAVITGAARGMGARFAAGLAARGVHVVGADLDADAMARTAEQINAGPAGAGVGDGAGRVVGTRADVTRADDHEAVARVALAEFGRLDFWVNNAGIFPFALAGDITPEQIGATLSVNVEGVLFGAQAAARHLGPGGAIVNMSSVSALRVRRGRGAYCSSKAAVAHLTESLAVEFGDRGIRVNSIAPGYIDTEMTRWVQEDPAALRNALDTVPLHRLGSPEEVLGPLLFLLSDSARYVTGHSIAVDGGSRHV